MNLVRRFKNDWDPFDLITDLQSDLNRVFSRSLSRRVWDGDLNPAVDIREEADQYVFSADLPGMHKDDFKVTVENNTLTLQGERKQVKETKDKGYYLTERVYGSFCRSFNLPSEVQPEKIKASYKDGVLEVILPKSENARPKQITVDVK
ncbi:MAG: Hsp20/alpha crystallin family protein [Candidatus Omnitrophica bacterium]|nr:Hsp20/alpha crystallin family protein [Candidatus Omnitrophota bacterium]